MKTLGEIKLGDIVVLVNWAPHNTELKYLHVDAVEPIMSYDHTSQKQIEAGFCIVTSDPQTGKPSRRIYIYKEFYNRYKQHETRTYNFYADVFKAFDEIEANLIKRLANIREERKNYEEMSL